MSWSATSSRPVRRRKGPKRDGNRKGNNNASPPPPPPPPQPTVTMFNHVTVFSTQPGQVTTAVSTQIVPTTVQVTLPGSTIPPDIVTSSITNPANPANPSSHIQNPQSQPSPTGNLPPGSASGSTVIQTINSVVYTSTLTGTSSQGSSTATPAAAPTADSTTASLASASAASRSTHSSAAGAIAGGVIGGLIFVAALIFLLLAFLRRRQNRRDASLFPVVPFAYAADDNSNPNHANSSSHLTSDWWQPASHPSSAPASASASSPDLAHLNISQTAVLTPNRSSPQTASLSSWAAAELPRRNEVLLRENEEFWEEIEQLRRENEELRSRGVSPEKAVAY